VVGLAAVLMRTTLVLLEAVVLVDIEQVLEHQAAVHLLKLL
jgi:hypothetical protein